MKHLSDCMGPTSWIFIYLAGILPVVVVLHPSLLELAMFLGADGVAYLINRNFEGKIFQKIFPETRLYFGGINKSEIIKLSIESKISFIQSVFSFPQRRAIYCCLGSYIKSIPGFLVIVFVWEHPERSDVVQFGWAFGLATIAFAYFYGAVFLEAHFYLSNLLHRIHKEFNWADAFRLVPSNQVRGDFELQETLSFASIVLSTCMLQAFVFLTNKSNSPQELAVSILLISVICLTLLGRLYFLGRSYFRSGLTTIFEYMTDLDYKNDHSLIPFHSAEILARFERSFNLLLDRLRLSEQELASWVLQAADKSRYRAIGEMSALIAHDMTGPLQVIRFCAEQLSEDPKRVEEPRYLSFLNTNVSRLLELISSLTVRLKAKGPLRSEVTFNEAHAHVTKLLHTQFSSEGFDRITIEVEPSVVNLRLNIPCMDLIHILDNLYRNATQNLLFSGIHDPRISVLLGNVDSEMGQVEILIQDNGTGLTLETFEQITAFQFAQTVESRPQGLGMRLIRRLVELHKGNLTVVTKPKTSGTLFVLSLPYLTSPISDSSSDEPAG